MSRDADLTTQLRPEHRQLLAGLGDLVLLARDGAASALADLEATLHALQNSRPLSPPTRG